MNIRVDLNIPINDGTEVVFRSPVDCSQVTGLIVYYPANGNTVSKEFAFADAHGNNIGDIDHLFTEDVVVKVILDVTKSMAFVQNADTNAYLEGRFAGIETTIDNLCPSFTESGVAVTCEPVEGYPLSVVSSIVPKQGGSGDPSPENVRPIEGHTAVTLTQCGKNLIPFPYQIETKTIYGITYTVDDDGTITLNGTATQAYNQVLNVFTLPKETAYALSATFENLPVGTNPVGIMIHTSDWKSSIEVYSGTINWIRSKSIPANTYHVSTYVASGAVCNNVKIKPQLEFGTAATPCEPYRAGDTFTMDLGQTVYGGSFHWANGTLTNGWHLLDVKNLGSSRIALAGGAYVNIPFYQDAPAADPANRHLAVCSHLSYGSSTGNNVFWLDSSGTGLRLKVDGLTTREAYIQWIEENDPMVAYPLATTTTSQLTPQEFKAIAGANTIYSDTGDTTVTGKANPAAEIEKLKNAILAMGANV